PPGSLSRISWYAGCTRSDSATVSGRLRSTSSCGRPVRTSSGTRSIATTLTRRPRTPRCVRLGRSIIAESEHGCALRTTDRWGLPPRGAGAAVCGHHPPAALGGVGSRASGSQLSWAGPVGVFEGAVEAAKVAESAGEGDRGDGPVGEAGIEELTAGPPPGEPPGGLGYRAGVRPENLLQGAHRDVWRGGGLRREPGWGGDT